LTFVGRHSELATLDAALAGASRAVVVMGEPGIGKTALLGELAARTSTRAWSSSTGARAPARSAAPGRR